MNQRFHSSIYIYILYQNADLYSITQLFILAYLGARICAFESIIHSMYSAASIISNIIDVVGIYVGMTPNPVESECLYGSIYKKKCDTSTVPGSIRIAHILHTLYINPYKGVPVSRRSIPRFLTHSTHPSPPGDPHQQTLHRCLNRWHQDVEEWNLPGS